MSAVAAGVAVVGLTGGTGAAAGGPVTVATPTAAASVDTSARDERITRGDLRPSMATRQERQEAAQRAALLGEEGDAIAVREAKLEAKREAAAKKKALAKKKAEAAKKRKAAAAKKAAEARIRELGYEPGTTDPRSIAKQILKYKYGYGSNQYACFNNIIIRESNWDTHATNASSGAYGIPQSLPGSKMASVGSDWRTNPATQIIWGIEYMKDTYGSPCGAWGFKSSHGWY